MKAKGLPIYGIAGFVGLKKCPAGKNHSLCNDYARAAHSDLPTARNIC